MNDDYLPAVQGGELAPYYAPPSPLPASSPAGQPADFISEHHPGGAPRFFGQQLPAGAQQAVEQLTTAFAGAMQQQRIPDAHWQAAVDWFHSAALAPPPRNVAAAHRYNLDGLAFLPEDHAHIHAFCNAMVQCAVPQSSVYRMLAWYADLTKKVTAQQQQQAPATRQSPSQGDTLDDLSDAEYDFVMARAEADKRAGIAELQARWADDFEPKMRVARQYFAGLSASDRDYLESAITKGGVLAANSAEFIDHLYRHALGPLPTGGALQAEIAQLESRMKLDRRSYLKDERAQLRLRELYRRRDG